MRRSSTHIRLHASHKRTQRSALLDNDVCAIFSASLRHFIRVSVLMILARLRKIHLYESSVSDSASDGFAAVFSDSSVECQLILYSFSNHIALGHIRSIDFFPICRLCRACRIRTKSLILTEPRRRLGFWLQSIETNRYSQQHRRKSLSSSLLFSFLNSCSPQMEALPLVCVDEFECQCGVSLTAVRKWIYFSFMCFSDTEKSRISCDVTSDNDRSENLFVIILYFCIESRSALNVFHMRMSLRRRAICMQMMFEPI